MPSAIVLSHDWIADELGHLGPWLDGHGFTVTRIHREQPRQLPSADLLIVLGSPDSVAGAHCPPAAQGEVEAVRGWIAQDRPYLGICFGAQVLARAAGGAVARLSTPFAGYVPLLRAPSAPDAVGGPWTVWHNDGITAPPTADVLGSLDHADLVFRIGRAWGLQPHVEVTPAILARMLRALGIPTDDSAPVVAALEADPSNAERAWALFDAVLSEG